MSDFIKDNQLSSKTCWLLTTGEAGCYSQLKGLAERLGVSYEKKLINLPFPWKLLPGHMCPWPLLVTKFGDNRLTPPWPDLVLSCGRRTVAAALGIKKASNGYTKAVHIQDPMIPTSYFDAVIAPVHDGCSGVNVLQTTGAIHHITKDSLQVAADEFIDVFADLPSPRVAVLLGGTSRAFQFTNEIIERLISHLLHLHESKGYSFLITPSVRTPPEVLDAVKNKLNNIPIFLWDRKGANPYQAMLATADYILVTCDSISMISEACSTGKPVYLIKMAGHSKRQSAFYDDMIKKGFIRWFQGEIEQWNYAPLDETGRSAEFVSNTLLK